MIFNLIQILGVTTISTIGVRGHERIPKFDTDEWWGIGEKSDEDTSVRPFRINFDDEVVNDLKQRLKNRRPFTETLEGVQSQYGINSDFLEEVLHYWSEKYDFKKRQDLLNEFPHYKTKIQGLDIHFMRVKPYRTYGKIIVPILMLHGWPSSSKEFVRVIPLLTAPRNNSAFVFKVIAVDLPGYGFSEIFNLIQILGVTTISTIGVRGHERIPKFDTDEWWGIGEKSDEDTSVRPFRINFDDEVVNDLKQRLKNRRPFTETLEGVQSQYGINSDFLEEVLHYWSEKYDFKKRQDLLNEFPHYKTKIQGLDIHFMRVKPYRTYGKIIVPILMLHGWPSSSKEFVRVIPLLTAPRNNSAFVFKVIAVDLPGYGFSEGTTKPGLSPVKMAIIMRNLMLRLGFNKFYIQAGDWGSQVASHLCTLYPEMVLGFHVNMPISSRTITVAKMLLNSIKPIDDDPVLAERTYPLIEKIMNVLRETGYYHLQATKPDTVGVALTDSPAGLAAYLIEKMGIGTKSDQLNTSHGGLAGLDLDDVLDTVTIMWVNSCIVTSMRLYKEAYARSENRIVQNIPTPVPTAAINLKYEILYQSPDMFRDKYPNLVQWTNKEFGGHFAALEVPEVIADDVFAAVDKFIEFNSRS